MNSNYQFTIMTNNYQESKDLALILKEKLEKINAKENLLCPDIVFIIGGDGTFLKAVSKYNQQLDKVKFITFKQGNIGFYHNFLINDIDKVVRALSANTDELVISELDLLEIESNKEIIYAINEVRLINFSQTLSCEVYINDQLLQVFSGSGIIVSTKTGTSGLMKTTGGAIILANAKLMEYQELFPVNNNIYHSLRAPIILDQNQIITLKLKDYVKEKINNNQLIVDTFNFHDKLVSKVKIKISNQTLKIFAFKTSNNSLIKKLNKSFIQF
ncbi:MAG: NAD(+)/NADH kinase [Spiroplasma sp.]